MKKRKIMKKVKKKFRNRFFSSPLRIYFLSITTIFISLGIILSFQNCSVGTLPIGRTLSSSIATSKSSAPNCTFNGSVLTPGASVLAFQNSTVGSGQTCQSEKRNCTGGALTGSYPYAICSLDAPASCLFNGVTIPTGSTTPAFQSSTVPSGQQCVQESRSCLNGILSGSFLFGNCSVNAQASCLFNGQTVSDGSKVMAFQNSTVLFGQTCVSELRSCANGALSGSYTFASCNVGTAASCSFNGQNLSDGGTVTAFQASSVPFGQTCNQQIRTCTNGNLSGTYTFANCSVGAQEACIFNGQTIPIGASVLAFQSSTVPSGQSCAAESRICSNGTLSGSYKYPSCNVNAPATCLFNNQSIPNGATVTAYLTETVASGQTCNSEHRICTNGALSGSYTFSTCAPKAGASCSISAHILSDGESITAFASSSVPAGQTCLSQTRICTNGNLSGSYTSLACVVIPQSQCPQYQYANINGVCVPDTVTSCDVQVINGTTTHPLYTQGCKLAYDAYTVQLGTEIFQGSSTSWQPCGLYAVGQRFDAGNGSYAIVTAVTPPTATDQAVSKLCHLTSGGSCKLTSNTLWFKGNGDVSEQCNILANNLCLGYGLASPVDACFP